MHGLLWIIALAASVFASPVSAQTTADRNPFMGFDTIALALAAYEASGDFCYYEDTVVEVLFKLDEKHQRQYSYVWDQTKRNAEAEIADQIQYLRNMGALQGIGSDSDCDHYARLMSLGLTVGIAMIGPEPAFLAALTRLSSGVGCDIENEDETLNSDATACEAAVTDHHADRVAADARNKELPYAYNDKRLWTVSKVRDHNVSACQAYISGDGTVGFYIASGGLFFYVNPPNFNGDGNLNNKFLEVDVYFDENSYWQYGMNIPADVIQARGVVNSDIILIPLDASGGMSAMEFGKSGRTFFGVKVASADNFRTHASDYDADLTIRMFQELHQCFGALQ